MGGTTTVIARRGAKLDWKLIEREVKPLLAVQGGQPVWDRLDELRQELSFGDR